MYVDALNQTALCINYVGPSLTAESNPNGYDLCEVPKPDTRDPKPGTRNPKP